MACLINKASIHVVGGAGTQVGKHIDNGGGYVVGGIATYTTFQTGNGDAVADPAGCTYGNNGSGKIRITKDTPPAFNSVIVGTLANVDFDEHYADGIYEVIAVDGGGGWIDIDCFWAGPPGTVCDVKVGGALATLQDTLDDDSTDAADYDRTIYTNLAETLAAAIDIDTGGGDISKNTHKKIIGFNTTPGDMDYGGAYYQGPLDAFKDSVDTSKCVDYDRNDGASDVFTIAINNVELRNLYIHNTNKAAGNHGTEITSVVTGVVIVNSKFAAVYNGVVGQVNCLVLCDCYFHPDIAGEVVLFSPNSVGLFVLGCFFKMNGALVRTMVVDTNSKSAYISGNIFYNCWRDIVIAAADVVVCNNTSHGVSDSCIRVVNAAATLIEYNNIFVLAAVDDYAVYLGASGGTILYSDYSLAYCSAGDLTVEPWYDDTNDISFQGAHSVKNVNPQLVDPSNGDFRLVNPDVLRGGRPDADDNAGQIGAVIQKYQFAERGRLTNRGRLGTFR